MSPIDLFIEDWNRFAETCAQLRFESKALKAGISPAQIMMAGALKCHTVAMLSDLIERIDSQPIVISTSN